MHEMFAQIVPAQGKLHSGFQEAKFVAGIVTLTFKLQTVNRPVAQHDTAMHP